MKSFLASRGEDTVFARADSGQADFYSRSTGLLRFDGVLVE
jgi:hypothetical protein